MKKGVIAQLLNSKVHGGIYQEVQLSSSVRELWTGTTSLLSCSAHVLLLLNLCQTPTQILGYLSLYCWAFWKLSPKPRVLKFILTKQIFAQGLAFPAGLFSARECSSHGLCQFKTRDSSTANWGDLKPGVLAFYLTVRSRVCVSRRMGPQWHARK